MSVPGGRQNIRGAVEEEDVMQGGDPDGGAVLTILSSKNALQG